MMFQIQENIYTHGLEAREVRLIRRKETGTVGAPLGTIGYDTQFGYSWGYLGSVAYGTQVGYSR